MYFSPIRPVVNIANWAAFISLYLLSIQTFTSLFSPLCAIDSTWPILIPPPILTGAPVLRSLRNPKYIFSLYPDCDTFIFASTPIITINTVKLTVIKSLLLLRR